MPITATKTIQDIGLALSTKSKQMLRIDPVTLPAGRTLSDWASFVFTIREDPEWVEDDGGRFGRNKVTANWADPEDDGWAVVAEIEGEVNGTVLEFAITETDSDIEGGLKRYAADVWGEGGAAGRVQFLLGSVEAAVVWLSMHSRARARV